MNKKLIYLFVFLLNGLFAQASNLRGLWVWNTSAIIASTTEVNKLINQCVADGTTDIYLYAYGMLTGSNKNNMQGFISKANCNNINVWAMDGYRGYFADWYGRSGFINFINTVIEYNATSTIDQQFIGVQGDNEPQDGQGEPQGTFHNGIKGSLLNSSGGGVWQATEVLDREYLMRDWVDMTKEAYDTCHSHNLRYGQAMVSWLDDYYGEEIYCTYNSQYKPVVEHMMDYLDDFLSCRIIPIL
ncbi:MAG: hypothetical protein J5I47_12740 [Vicingus serpentipes]|nr:hypothetical protein [Vicingus serpentipes]